MIAIAMDNDPKISTELRAPFPWFGGKRRVADLVWARLGDVDTYNEPFAGSLAVLLARPHAPRVETVNDLDCYLANFWRALQADPEAVAYYADGPVNEADLHARHRWLVETARARVERVMADPEYFDAQIAGWWVWGQCLWIGSGWCQTVATERRTEQVQKRPKLRERGDDGVPYRRWQGGGQGGGSGVHAPRFQEKRPHISNRHGDGGGMGVHRSTLSLQLPALAGDSGCVGRGVHRKLPALSQGRNDRSSTGRGVLSEGVRTQGLYDYLQQLAARLRRVRVCCGDWQRVLTPSVTTYIGTCGVFLDPPYQHDLRERCYAEDHDISADVRAWAITNGENPDMRIALCGYADEHGLHMPSSWDCVPWKAHGGYSRTERGVENRAQERIWFSPHCVKDQRLPLFAVDGGHFEPSEAAVPSNPERAS